MRIDQIEIRYATLPLVQPFVTSFGREETRETILVAVRSEGLTGWGEAATSKGPWYEYETVETCWHVLNEFLGPCLVGQDVASPEQAARLMAPVRGHHIAKMGLEAAIWDLLAKARGVSMAEMLGGVRERVAVGVSVGVQPSPEQLLEVIGGYLAQGYVRIKIKIRPGWDAHVVRRVRERFPEVLLMADANSAYTLADADMLLSLDDYGLLMVEQPLSYDDLLDHAELQRRLRTPICLDESVPSLAAARVALLLGSGRIINIKPGRVGGLVAARAIHDLCRSSGIPVWCGGMLETGIGRAHNVAVASLPGFTLPGDISASDRYFREDIVEPPFTVGQDGTMAVPTGPGIGVRVVPERLDAATQRRCLVGEIG
ncbi:MAG TPA: o-succinylbenzoate synthase [Anaerolineae bacterium]|nr:o-succinylbenzoate synthase [Anaerolineae bacterium]HNS49827.1 o-succinylbenzoate synthase [Anaerolineae bacterium]